MGVYPYWPVKYYDGKVLHWIMSFQTENFVWTPLFHADLLKLSTIVQFISDKDMKMWYLMLYSKSEPILFELEHDVISTDPI